jgi:GDP-L-fucose synthase
MKNKDVIYVSGHTGMVGSSIVRNYNRWNDTCIGRTHSELDLTDFNSVERFFELEKPTYVINAAAKVGGIKDNDSYPVQYIMDNTAITYNLIKCSYKFGVKKLLFLGSSCIYPKFAPQPIKEEYLLTGKLEPTNEWYAIAKIIGIKMCQAYRKQYGCNYISVMPCNLYGEGDTYDVNRSHVIPGLITKFHKAKINKDPFVECWGTGKAIREFLYVDDLARAVSYIMDVYNDSEPINVGSGKEISIKDLATIISKTVGYDGEIKWNSNISDGTPRKVMDSGKINELGWKPMIDLEEGLQLAYHDYLKKYGQSI